MENEEVLTAALKKIEARLNKIEKPKGAGFVPVLMNIMQSYISMNALIDRKCALLFSLNSAILALSVANLVTQVNHRPNLIIPTFLLLLFNIGSLVMTFLASKNYLSQKKLKRDGSGSNNLLLFGNMEASNIGTFTLGLLETFEDKEHLFSSLAENVYYLKADFKKKNTYINLAYNILIIGILIAIPAFILVIGIA